MSADRLLPPKFSGPQWQHISQHYAKGCRCKVCLRMERYDRRKALARLDSGAAE